MPYEKDAQIQAQCAKEFWKSSLVLQFVLNSLACVHVVMRGLSELVSHLGQGVEGRKSCSCSEFEHKTYLTWASLPWSSVDVKERGNTDSCTPQVMHT